MLQDREVQKAINTCPDITQLTDGKRLYLKFPKREKNAAGVWAWVGEPSWKLDYTKPNKVTVKEVKCPTTGDVLKHTLPVRDTFTLGVFSKYSCKQAREEAEAIREALKPRMVDGVMVPGTDPKVAHKTMVEVQTQAAENAKLAAANKAIPGTFRYAAEKFFVEQKLEANCSEDHLDDMETVLRLRCYPTIANVQCSDLEEHHFLAIARGLMKGTLLTYTRGKRKGEPFMDQAGAKRMLHAAKRVMGYARLEDMCRNDPLRGLSVKDIIGPRKVAKVPRAAATSPEAITKVMHAFNGLQNTYLAPQTRRQAWVQAQTAQRPINVAHMRWEDIDLDAMLWTIPAGVMKRGKADKSVDDVPHYVPLATQTVALLREQREYQKDNRASRAKFVFHNYERNKRNTQPVGKGHLIEVMRDYLKIGPKEHSVHGFRAVMRSLGRTINIPGRFIEAHLAHLAGIDLDDYKKNENDPSGTANMVGIYMREMWTPQRYAMVQQWADYLDHLVYGTPFTVPAPEYMQPALTLVAQPVPEFRKAA